MAGQNAQAVAEKWARNLTNAGDSIRAGVDAVTESPGAAAVRAKQVMIQNFMTAMQDGTFEKGHNSYTLADWKAKMKDIGVNRISTGTTAAKPKVQQFLTQFLPVMAQASAEAKAIPKLTEEDAINRVRTVMRAAKAFKANRR